MTDNFRNWGERFFGDDPPEDEDELKDSDVRHANNKALYEEGESREAQKRLKNRKQEGSRDGRTKHYTGDAESDLNE